MGRKKLAKSEGAGVLEIRSSMESIAVRRLPTLLADEFDIWRWLDDAFRILGNDDDADEPSPDPMLSRNRLRLNP